MLLMIFLEGFSFLTVFFISGVENLFIGNKFVRNFFSYLINEYSLIILYLKKIYFCGQNYNLTLTILNSYV